MNLRVSTKNNAADPEKGFLIKSILKLCGRTRAMPTAWELRGKQVILDIRWKIYENPVLFFVGNIRKSFNIIMLTLPFLDTFLC